MAFLSAVIVVALQLCSPTTSTAVPTKYDVELSTDTVPTQVNWAGISNYYLYSCNSTIRAEALNTVRAAGLKVVRVFLLSTEGVGSVAACSSTPIPDVEPQTVGVYNDAILEQLDELLFEASIRGIKITVALHDRWSLGCWRSDAYQRKYNLTQTDCQHNPKGNDPTRFYAEGRNDFKNRISHILTYKSRHTGQPIGQWSDALFSIEAENEAFGAAVVTSANTDWMCEMATTIRAHIHPKVLVTTGGGGVGSTKLNEMALVKELAACQTIDVIALHSYSSPQAIDSQLVAYKTVVGDKRIILQEWGATGATSTAQALAFTAVAQVAAKHEVPQLVWALQPSHMPLPSTSLSVSPPSPLPSPGKQRVRGDDGEWITNCTSTSCPTEVWVTALYPATQAAALQQVAYDWPEVWGCSNDGDCRYNGQCVTGACVCDKAWRGPTCAALRLLPTTTNAGFRHVNSSSWGGSIMHNSSSNTYHMFSSFITENCGLDAWSTNSEIVRATSATPLGPYVMQEVVASRFAHEPNLVFGTGPNKVLLLGTMYPTPPTEFANCTGHPATANDPVHPIRNTYLWEASSAVGIAKAERQLAINAQKWDTDILHNGAICDTNAAAAMGDDGNLVGLWRRCETDHLHTVPHTFTATSATNATSYQPNISVNVPFMSHANAEDPMVYSKKTSDGAIVFHAVLHDEQITRCADAPVGCWPGGRHAFSVDQGQTWDYSAFDAYNGTVEYTDGTVEDYYLRARPHLLLNADGEIIALSNGLRPTKASEYVYTLVQPVFSTN
eukprot:m.54383 g.54383  ORF g.54383 m.54383 type:complete len:782 (-) comp21903_c0_seq1:67-2412(-)